MPVVSAENRIARAVAEPQHCAAPGPPVHHKVDVERDPDPEQQRQSYDVRVIQRQRHGGHDDDRHQRREQQWRQHQSDIEQPAQCYKQDHRDCRHRGDCGGAERPDDGGAGGLDRDRRAAGVGRHRGHLVDKPGEPPAVARRWFRQHLNARAAVGEQPVARDRRRDIAQGHGLCAEGGAELVELRRQKPGQRLVDRRARSCRVPRQARANPRAIAASCGSGRDDLPSTGVSCASAFPAARRISSAPGGGSGLNGVSVDPSRVAASSICASLAFWSVGTKLSIDSTPATSGKRSRAAEARRRAQARRQESIVNGLRDRRVHQIVEGPHRLGVRVLGVQRVGVEAQPRQPGRSRATASTANAPSSGRRRRRTCRRAAPPSQSRFRRARRAAGKSRSPPAER